MNVEVRFSRGESNKASGKFDKTSFSEKTQKEETVVFASIKDTRKAERERQINEEVSKFKAGDEKAREKVIELLHPVISKYTWRRVSPHGSKNHEDVTQVILLAVDEILPTYEGDNNSFLPFVYGIAAHKVADDHRNYRQWKEESTDQIPEGTELFGVNSNKKSVAEIAVQKYEATIIKKVAEANLSEKERTILKMRVIDGMKAREVGELLDMTANHVRVKQHRALKKLREELSEENNSSSPRRKRKSQAYITPEEKKEKAKHAFLLKEKGLAYKEIAKELHVTVREVGHLLTSFRIAQARQRAPEKSLEEKEHNN